MHAQIYLKLSRQHKKKKDRTFLLLCSSHPKISEIKVLILMRSKELRHFVMVICRDNRLVASYLQEYIINGR